MTHKTLLITLIVYVSFSFSLAFSGGMDHQSTGDTHAMSGEMHEMVAHHMFGLPPAGVMGAHLHHTGKVMFSYRYMFMNMDGNRDGNNRVDVDDVLADYMVSPTEMQMQMHMLGIMYAPADSLSLMAMIPYVRLEMDHVTRMGGRFTTKSEGLGDIKISALYSFYQTEKISLLSNLGLSIPTGSIDEKDDTPAAKNAQLPYPMQTGSGTFDFFSGITYLGNSGAWSWGSQLMTTISLGENDNDYSLGNVYTLTTWFSRQFKDWVGVSARLDGQIWEDIDGADPVLNPMMVPTADPELRGGKRIDLLFGVNLDVPRGRMKGAQFTVEGGLPVYQHLDGPQLETDWLLTAGLQWMF